MTTMNPRALPDGGQSKEKGVFDISALDSITKHNPTQRKVLIALVTSLTTTSRAELSHSLALLQAGEEAMALKILHTLRGAVGNLGAKRFAEATIAIERAVHAQAENVALHFNAASAELSRTMTLAEIWIANSSSSE